MRSVKQNRRRRSRSANWRPPCRRARAACLARWAAGATVADLCAIVVEHEQADRRRQIAMAAIGVDRGHQIGQRYLAAAGDFLQALPERVFQTDAGLVARDHDRAFDNRRFHRPSPLSIRCRSRSRLAFACCAASSLRRCLGWPWARRLLSARRSSCRFLARLRAIRRLTSSAMPRLDGGPIHRLPHFNTNPRITAKSDDARPVATHWACDAIGSGYYVEKMPTAFNTRLVDRKRCQLSITNTTSNERYSF